MASLQMHELVLHAGVSGSTLSTLKGGSYFFGLFLLYLMLPVYHHINLSAQHFFAILQWACVLSYGISAQPIVALPRLAHPVVALPRSDMPCACRVKSIENLVMHATSTRHVATREEVA
jgi:hypothetical protein